MGAKELKFIVSILTPEKQAWPTCLCGWAHSTPSSWSKYLKAEEETRARTPSLSPRAQFLPPSRTGQPGDRTGMKAPSFTVGLACLTGRPVKRNGTAPPLLRAGDGGSRSDRWTRQDPGRRFLRAPMAAVLRGGRGHGWRGRGQGGGRRHGGGRGGGADADAALPAQQGRVNPPGYEWQLWREGNTNRLGISGKDDQETRRIFKELEDSPRVDRQELNSYGVPEAILGQREEVMRVINEIVTKYNVMSDARRTPIRRR